MLKDFFRKLIAKTKWHVTGIIVTTLTASIIYTSVPYLFAQMIDSFIQADPATGTPMFWPYLIIGLTLLYSICNRLKDILVNLWSRLASRLTLKDIYNQLAQYNLHFFENHQAGRLSQKILQIPQALRMLAPIMVSMLWSSIATCVIILQLASFNWRISALVFTWVILSFSIMLLHLKLVRSYSGHAADMNSHLSAHLVDWLGNMPLVKLFSNLSAHENAHQSQLTEQTTDAFYRIRYTTIRMSSYIQLLYYLLITATIFVLIAAWQDQTMTPVQMAAAYPMIRIAVGDMWNTLIMNFAVIAEYLGQMKDGLNTLTDELSHEPRLQTAPKALKNPYGDILLNQVNFTYPGTETAVIHHFSLNIAARQRVGVIGLSGAGKSTLAHLLMGLYIPQSGNISIGGEEINGDKIAALRAQVAYVPQDSSLFHRSLMDNIRYGKQGATDAEVIAAAKKAHAHEFIAELPDGYHTLVGERGVKLSGGQRQRVAIARAILKDAPILILDEATSALDSESERLIQASLQELMVNKTVIAIAHRLSTIKHLDRLIVMEQGKIIEDGNHEELLEQNGVYAKLWKMQSGGFIGE